jgi:hypothetical protein
MDSVSKLLSNQKHLVTIIMKNYFKVLGVIAVVGALSFQSCETTELDLRDNPNALSADQASPDFLLNNIQLGFRGLVQNMGTYGAELTRIDYMFGKNYVNVYQPSSFTGAWSSAYATVLEDIKAMEALASENGLTYHSGMGKFIKAFTMVTLVDYFGDVPYSQANLGSENFNPGVDGGASIYEAAHALLDSAIADFNAGGPAPQNDFFYDGSAAKWIKAANTLKLKMYATTRVHDGGIDADFNAIIASGNYIAKIADDMQFTYGTNEVQPDTRHPGYSGDYTPNGGNNYRAIHLMNYMNENDDPRRRYYFYRQNAATPGIDADPALETLQCSLQTPPAHYEGFPFCGLPNGYWGRDHGNDEGIPPDGGLRTIVGVYPAGGSFDDSSFKSKFQGMGGKGQGITPILLSSSVHFWQAEVALAAGNATGAKEHLTAGLANSVAKVTAFGALDAAADLSFEPSAADITAHATMIETAFDADSTGGWNVLGQEFFVALYGNGSDAYNFYRRTGYPNNLQPNMEPNPGAFVRSMWYPSNFVNTNSSVNQKPDVTQTVFWDNGSTSLY